MQKQIQSFVQTLNEESLIGRRGGLENNSLMPMIHMDSATKTWTKGKRTLERSGRCRREPPRQGFTILRDTLLLVAEHQNVTLSLPRELLRRVKRLAADRDTSVSSLMTEALTRLANEARRYSAARSRSLVALRSARSLGTGGRRTWSRDELRER